MSSPRLKLGQKLGLLPTTSEEQYESEDLVVAEVAEISLTEGPPPSSSSNLIQHFSHDHPLILHENRKEQEGNVGGQESINCRGCRDDPVSDDGPIYGCSSTASDCEDFFLHKSCAELPMMMVSTLHPEHLLQLLHYPNDPFTCDICEGDILGFGYSCRPCNFDLHITCASQHKFQPQRHIHSFILHKLATFTCDACGVEKSKKISFLCTTCQFQVHTYKSCSSSSYPLTVKQIRHSHQLILTYFFQLDFDFSNKSCKICSQKLNSVFCVYYCSTCAYIAHVSCATSEELIRDEHKIYEVVADQCDLATEFIQPVETTNEISRLGAEGEDQKTTELLQQQQQLLDHFSHPHRLILSNEEPKIDELCDGCSWPISVPFYTCADQCNFSLHKQCVELLGKIRHPLHRHPLTLKAKHPRVDSGKFYCHGCEVWCNGFTYTCDECNELFSLDVSCSLFSDTLSHEGHQCALNLLVGDETNCSACGLNCVSRFNCEECNFNLDLLCASLPKATMHKCPKPDWGIRPIKLTYYSVEDESGEYYCDICEERRGQNHWFYYCEACDYSSHPQCILGKRDKAVNIYNRRINHRPVSEVENGDSCVIA